MNCRKCEAHLSAYIDEELDSRTAQEVTRHLSSCAGCRELVSGLERVASILAGLPRLEMSETEQRRLMEGLRREASKVEAEERRARASLFPRLATAAAVLVTAVVVTIALMTTPTSRKASEPAETPVADSTEQAAQATDMAQEGTRSGNVAAGQGDTTTVPSVISPATASLLPTPHLVKSSNDYDKDDVAEYSQDLGTRLDFYSDLWYRPASASGAAEALSGADQSTMHRYYSSMLSSLAAESGEDPASLEKSLSIAASQIPPGKFAVPCFVEKALYQGQPVWIISFSVPEDAQLFTNPEVASLVNLAKQISASGNLQNSALMEALTATVMPGTYSTVSNPSRNAVGASADLDLQALITNLAESNNLASYLRLLSELDEDELVRLVSGSTGYPINISSSLLDTLTWRIWVINPDSGQVIFRPSR